MKWLKRHVPVLVYLGFFLYFSLVQGVKVYGQSYLITEQELKNLESLYLNSKISNEQIQDLLRQSQVDLKNSQLKLEQSQNRSMELEKTSGMLSENLQEEQKITMNLRESLMKCENEKANYQTALTQTQNELLKVQIQSAKTKSWRNIFIVIAIAEFVLIIIGFCLGSTFKKL